MSLIANQTKYRKVKAEKFTMDQLKDKEIEMYSSQNEGKSIVA